MVSLTSKVEQAGKLHRYPGQAPKGAWSFDIGNCALGLGHARGVFIFEAEWFKGGKCFAFSFLLLLRCGNTLLSCVSRKALYVLWIGFKI